MYMRIKKILAVMLAVIMLAGLFPVVVLGAPVLPGDFPPTRQNPVTRSEVVVGSSSGNNYNLNIRWERPARSTVSDNRGVPMQRLIDEFPGGIPSTIWSIYPIRYDIRMRNATVGDAFGVDPALNFASVTPTIPAPAGQGVRPGGMMWENSTGSRSMMLQPASLYEIEIIPFRNVPALMPLDPNAPPGTLPTIIGAPAALEAADPNARGLLFLTDITPTALGRGNSVTVTWDNPTWGGANVFPYWYISWQIPTAQGINTPFARPGTVMRVGGVDAPPTQITQNPDGTLTATVTHPDIPPIGNVNVRVEPMTGPNPQIHNVRLPRGVSLYSNMHIGGQNFGVYFTQNEFSTVATMIPELNINQIGAQFIQLWWPSLSAIVDDLRMVAIEEWPADMEGVVPTSQEGFIRVLAERHGHLFISMNDFFVGPGLPRERRGFSLALHMTDGRVIRTEIVVFDPLVAEFSPYRPEIVRLDHVGEGRLEMQWLAFVRFPAVPAEMASVPANDPWGGRFVDTSVTYEIFVSDTWENLHLLTTPLMTLVPGQLTLDEFRSPLRPQPAQYVYDPTWEFNGFHITQYQTITPQGHEIRDIAGNRVYFVRIRVVREPRIPNERASNWAYGSVYVPPLIPMPITPEMIASPPVYIPNEPGVDGVRVTENSIPLRWDTRYLEILRPNPNPPQSPYDPVVDATQPNRNTWHTLVGVTHDPHRLIFGRSAAHINYVASLDPTVPRDQRHLFLNEMLSPASRNRMMGMEEFVRNLRLPTYLAPFLNEARWEVRDYMFEEWGYSGFGDPATSPPMALRLQDTSIFDPRNPDTPIPFSYEIHVIPYQAMRMHSGGFEGYKAMLMANTGMWTSIGQPTITEGIANHVVGGLLENTPYIIFIRPYVTVGGEILRAAYPTFVIGTTVVTPDRPVPDPTTPVLHPVPRYTTRNQVAVRWRVQADMVYELRISHFFTDYPNGGTTIPISFENLQEARDGRLVELENPRALLWIEDIINAAGEEIPYFHLRIQERFPDTTYYIWARAIGVDENGNVATPPSQPSNPVDIHTLEIEPPPPPRSLARVPQNLLNMFNRYNETTYRNDEPDNLIISFMRIFQDLRDDMGNLVERAESGVADGGSVTPLNMPNLSETEAYVAIHMLRFEDLRANQRYFVRARTILTVQRGGPDIFSYEVQVANNEDFLDAITFTIPPLIPMDPVNTRRATSEWVEIELDTGLYDGEFDGVHRPDQYPLPEYDWEITYDPTTQTLTWRFRTNQRGADGRLDQNVDQRFISRLIQSRVFTFTADLSSYNGMPITNREIILPESILRAFDERRITFEILAGDKNIQIPPGAFDTAQTRGLQVGIGSYYRIALNGVSAGMPPLQTNTSFATIPQRLTVSAITPARTANLTTFARPINVELPVEDFITPDGMRTGLFVSDPNTASWRDAGGQLDFINNSISSGIRTPSTFAGISRNAPPMLEPQNPANAPMQRVSSLLTITDMVVFDPNRQISANEFNNIVNAVMTGSSSVTMGAQLPAASERSMRNARLLAPQDLTREAAIDIMVRLYENRTRQILTPMSSVDSIPGMQNASPAFVRNLRIAADLGFITGPLEPRDRLTMGEMMNMVDIIKMDS
jgi:hypothetical protein